MRSGPVWSARRPRLHDSGRLSLVDITHSLALRSRPVKSEACEWPAVGAYGSTEGTGRPGGRRTGSALRRGEGVRKIRTQRWGAGGGRAATDGWLRAADAARRSAAGPFARMELDIRPGGENFTHIRLKNDICH